MCSRGIDNLFSWINADERIVETYNNQEDTVDSNIYTHCISARENNIINESIV